MAWRGVNLESINSFGPEGLVLDTCWLQGLDEVSGQVFFIGVLLPGREKRLFSMLGRKKGTGRLGNRASNGSPGTAERARWEEAGVRNFKT